MSWASTPMSTRRIALYLIYLAVVTSLLAELIVRIYFAFETGPRTLLYGTEWHRNTDPSGEFARRKRTMEKDGYQAKMAEHLDAEKRPDSVELHQNEGDGYTKLFPHEKKSTRDVDTGQRIHVTINSHGFRGRDFTVEKQEGVVRVLTLGSSSTFGFYNRDNETYPYHLERILNERCEKRKSFEVINFGIPHATSSNMAALFLAEGITLNPDVVTVYQGRNDSVSRLQYGSIVERVYSILVHRLMLIALLDQIFVGDRESVTAASDKLGPRTQKYVIRYLHNLESILNAAKRKGILLIIANQQATPLAPYPRAELERLSLKGVTYQDEADRLRAKMESREDIDTFEFSFLVHVGMMEALGEWALENRVPFVNIIETLDQDRHYLLSWVHLHPNANRVVAEKLSEVILANKCV